MDKLEKKLSVGAELIKFYISADYKRCPVCDLGLEDVTAYGDSLYIGLCLKCGTIGVSTEEILVSTFPQMVVSVAHYNVSRGKK
jgi:hypothetical protein